MTYLTCFAPICYFVVGCLWEDNDCNIIIEGVGSMWLVCSPEIDSEGRWAGWRIHGKEILVRGEFDGVETGVWGEGGGKGIVQCVIADQYGE